MKPYIINESEVFAINDNEPQLVRIGDVKVLVVDDFFKNPDKVTDVMDKSKYTTNEYGFLPGIRSKYDITNYTIIQFLSNYVESFYQELMYQSDVNNLSKTTPC